MLIAALALLQVIIFAILIFIFRRILTQNVVSATRHLEVLNEDFSRKEQELDRRMSESKQKAEEIVAKARDEAEAQKAQILKDTEAKRGAMLDEAQSKSTEIMQQAEKSRQLLIADMENKIAKESINKACELAHLILPDDYKKKMHAECVDEFIEGGFEHIERLRIPADVKEVKITTAFALSEKQSDAMAKKLKKFIAKDIEIKQELNPRIGAGLIVTIGSLVLDGSLKSKIAERSKELGNN